MTERHRIPATLRAAVIRRDGRRCYLCRCVVGRASRRRGRTRTPERQLTLDHVQPLSAGGATTFENLRVCCRRCNMAKSGRHAAR